MKSVILEPCGAQEYPICRIPGIVCTQKGTLLCCYECRSGPDDWAVSEIGVRRSTDGGVTWSERSFPPLGSGRTVMNNPIFIADGELVHLLFCRNYRKCFYCVSSDDGLSWSKPQEITYAPNSLLDKYNWTVAAIGPGHGIRLNNGRLLAPVWLARNAESIFKHVPSVVTTLYSDDRGVTWHCGEIIFSEEELVDPSESCLVETDDGVKIFFRHTTKTRLRKTAVSADGISGWHDFAYERELPDPCCAAGLVGFGGRIWFSNCASRTARNNLTVRESRDGGKSWPYRLLISKTAGYSDICYDASRDQLTVFHENIFVRESGARVFQLEAVCLSPSELNFDAPEHPAETGNL